MINKRGDEGNLLKSQWADKDRLEHFLDNNSSIGMRIIQTLNERGLNGEEFLQEVRNILSVKKADIEKIEAAFPEYPVVGISAKEGINLEEFYAALFELAKKV